MAVRGNAPPVVKPDPPKCLESIDFDMHESEQYISYVTGCSEGKLGKWKGGFRWIYLCGVGLGAGAAAVFIETSLVYTMQGKYALQAKLTDTGHGVVVRYLAWLLTSLGLAAVAGVLVCYVEPLAAGSGIPEIKCYLNGIRQPNVLRFKTMIAKACGIVGSVAAGLPCGKEGPMIHSGAIVGAQAAKANAGPLIGPYRPTCEARDLTAAGAAAGVAAAFGAPIGGVLFAVEEGATHMNPTILVRSFVCATVAALTVRFFSGPREGGRWGILGTNVPVEFGRFNVADRGYFIWELAIFALIGVAGGLLGAIANALNARLTQWRMRWIGPRGHRRFLEVMGVTAAIVSFNFFAPLLHGSHEIKSFSPVQRLFVDAGANGMDRLFHDQMDMHTGTLLLFATAHYTQVIWTYGLGVPSGLFVPSLLGGAAFGRLVGQALQGCEGIAASPGVYALVGACAMLSGMARITISLSVILMETTGEAEWGIPIFLTTVAAKWVGDFFNKGIYDIHIELKNVPLLEQQAEKQMITLQASDFMSVNVVTLDAVTTVNQLVNVLQSCEHNGFPVIDPDTRHFLGLVDRSTLHHLLRLGGHAGAFSNSAVSTAPGLVPYEEMLRHRYPSLFPSMEDVRDLLATDDYSQIVDLRPYTNLGCFTVPERASAMRCYRLFRTMGLRHLPVLGRDHEVIGIITRQNLLHAQEGHIAQSQSSASSASASVSKHASVQSVREEELHSEAHRDVQLEV